MSKKVLVNNCISLLDMDFMDYNQKQRIKKAIVKKSETELKKLHETLYKRHYIRTWKYPF